MSAGTAEPKFGSAGSRAARGQVFGFLPGQPLAQGGTTRGSTKEGAASPPATGTAGGRQGEANWQQELLVTQDDAPDTPSQQAMGCDDEALCTGMENARRSKASNTLLQKDRPEPQVLAAASSASDSEAGSLARGSAALRLSASSPMILKIRNLTE